MLLERVMVGQEAAGEGGPRVHRRRLKVSGGHWIRNGQR